MTLELGGPGVACSSMRVRRFEAGELLGDERARTESHLAGCGRCQATQRELARERALLARDLPFETLAAGVAERLARTTERRRPSRVVGLALAAGIAAAVAVPALLRSPSGDAPGFRLKGGGAELTLYARDGATALALSPSDPVPPGAALRIGLTPAGHRFAVVALVDADGAAILFSGAAEAGVLPGAFEWTGAGEGTLVAVLADEPLDVEALASRLSREGPAAASPGPGAEVIVRTLRRGAR
jgi:hypothetical protein